MKMKANADEQHSANCLELARVDAHRSLVPSCEDYVMEGCSEFELISTARIYGILMGTTVSRKSMEKGISTMTMGVFMLEEDFAEKRARTGTRIKRKGDEARFPDFGPPRAAEAPVARSQNSALRGHDAKQTFKGF